MLERYRDNDRVMMIAGYNPLTHRVGDGDYYASACAQIWGWATWRRAIAKFDFKMERYPAFRAPVAPQIIKTLWWFSRLKSR